MLRHEWSTHKNEAMNKGVASYAPKDKTYSTTMSLVTRVEMAGAVQIGAYQRYWEQVYSKNNLTVDKTLRNQLIRFDTKKEKKMRERKRGKENCAGGGNDSRSLIRYNSKP